MRVPSTLPKLLLGLCLALSAVVAPAQAQAPAAVQKAIAEANKQIEAIIKIPANRRTFENTVAALDDVFVKLDSETSIPMFLSNVHPDEAVRDQGRAAEEAISDWYIAVGKNENLYKAVKQYADTKPTLIGEKKRLLEFTLRDYRRAGMELSAEDRARLAEIEKEISRLSIEFDQNIAEDETKVFFTKEELEGIPEDVMGRLKLSNGLYVVGMDGPTFNAVMDYAENPLTRQKAWIEYKRRGGQANVRVLERMVKLRAEAAELLGYENTVDYELEIRMAKDDETVAEFYEKLRPIVRKKAEKDLAEFTEAKREHTGDDHAVLQPWDYSFYKTRLMREKYAVDSEKVREYFPLQSVLDGLFEITQRLYGIEYKDVTAQAASLDLPTWHPDVKLYEVYDSASKKLIGRFFFDPFPRENKYNHAAVWGLRPRRKWDNREQVPLAAMVVNFTKPSGDRPSLLPHDQVETFFHEFGHVLHHMLSNATYGRFSGTAVARDFVEAPSQMMENWVWSPEVLKLFAKHYQSGEALPEETLKSMKAARTLGSGLEAEHQFYYGLVDQAYHTAPKGVVDTTKVGIDLYSEIELYPAQPETFFQASFGHLTGYQGAYYGYMWSLVYAQDMFQRFEELGVLSPEAGKYYRDKILAPGGSKEETDLLKDYLGREPKMDAFLRYLGLDPEAGGG